MVLHQTRASWKILTILTKFNPKSIPNGPKNPNFDLVVKTGWNQCHGEDYQILIPTIIHGLKSEIERSRYHKNRDDASIDALLTSEGHNFWSDHWIFKFHTFSETGSQYLSKGVKINPILGLLRLATLKGHCLEMHAKAINSPKHLSDLGGDTFFWTFCSLPSFSTHFSLFQTPKNTSKLVDSSLFTKKPKVLFLNQIFFSLVLHLGFGF